MHKTRTEFFLKNNHVEGRGLYTAVNRIYSFYFSNKKISKRKNKSLDIKNSIKELH